MRVWPEFYFSPPRLRGVRAWKKTALEWLQTILFVVVFYLAVTVIFLEAYQIPSGSMEPTLHGHPDLLKGDRVVALKWISRFFPFRRGEIIIFISAEDHKTFIVKRLIGLPGDKIEVKPPHVVVNGEIFRHPHFPAGGYTNPRVPSSFTVHGSDHPEAVRLSRLAAAQIQEEHPGYDFLGTVTFAICELSGQEYLFDLEIGTDAGNIFQQVRLCDDPPRSFLDPYQAPGKFVRVDPTHPDIALKAQQAFHLWKKNISAVTLLRVGAAGVQQLSGKYYFFILKFQDRSAKKLWKVVWYEGPRGRDGQSSAAVVEKLPVERDFYGIDSPLVVPQGFYFVMGDNSANSNDSRFWGPLPFENVLGKAVLVFWPIPHSKILRAPEQE